MLCHTICRHTLWVFLLLMHLGNGSAESSAKQRSLDLPLSDATGIRIDGPHRFLTVDGKTGLHLTSHKSTASIDTTLHHSPQGSLSFWMASLEDLSKFSIHSQIYSHAPSPTAFHLVSDTWPADEESTQFGMYWRTSYPQLMARFDQGKVWTRLDHGLAPFAYGEMLPLRKQHWYSVVLTWDREAKSIALYVNGQMMGCNPRADGFAEGGSKLYLGNPMMVFRDLKLKTQSLRDEDVASQYATMRPGSNQSTDADIAKLMNPQTLQPLDIKRDSSWQESYACSFTKAEDLKPWLLQTGDEFRDEFVVRTTDEGLLVKTPDRIDKETRMYLWSPRTFEGDQWIEYDFRIESPEGLSLLVFAASGAQREDFLQDYEMEKTGRMGIILGKTRNYHWEYVRRVECMRTDVETQYMGKNPWGTQLVMGCIPRLKEGEWHRLRLVKVGNRIHGSINGKTVFDRKDDSNSQNGPVLDFGRIGLRQMYKTSMRYRNFVVYEKRPAPKHAVAQLVTKKLAKKPAKEVSEKSAKNPKSKLPPTYAEVAYGPHERNVLDFWQAEGEGPRPLLVAIHGGGWTNGDKAKRRSIQLIKSYLDQGISYAAINYRYTRQAILPGPVHDAARSIQFLRTKSETWNIKESRIAVSGGSAGACSSMWILLHDDMADPNAEDPILRESTRVCAAAVWEGQVSLDPKLLVEWLGPNVLQHRMLNLSVGERTIDGALANYEKHKALYDEFAPYNHVDGNDPPLFMTYKYEMDLPCKDGNHGIHHPVFGVKLKEKSDQVGHECHLMIKGEPQQGDYRDRGTFLRAKLLAPESK